MRILLIRHGDPDYTIDGLTEKGQREALALRDRLLRLPIRKSFLSPHGRARDTAAPYLAASGCPAETLSFLQEFPIHQWDGDMGRRHVVWDFLPDTRQKHPEWKGEDWASSPAFAASDTEPLTRFVFDRLDQWTARFGYVRDGDLYRVTGQDYRHAQIAVFCHFGIAAVLLSRLLNISAEQLLHGLYLAPTSVTTVASEERKEGLASWRCIGVGDVSHLYHVQEPISYSGFFGDEDPY